MSWLPLYRALTFLLAPAIEYILRRRLARGREDPQRIEERRGRASRPRPGGALLWLHAASIGEAQSVLTLVEAIHRLHPGIAIIMTTGTVSSAKLMAERLPAGALHQFAPLDRMPWVKRFLDHWRPDAALWIESELWPNLLGECRRRGLPMVMVNARISRRSARLWKLLPGALSPLLRGFQLCLAQDEGQAERLRSLGAEMVKVVGNVKYAAAPLDVDETALADFMERTAGRPLWLAASTHPGEEDLVADVHLDLREEFPGLLTFIVPRHPSRAEEITRMLSAKGLRFAQRSRGEILDPSIELYLADSIGELGLFYRLCRLVFMGGSLVPHGGQNLLEPARLFCALLHGPHCENFAGIVEALDASGGAEEAPNAESLALKLRRLMRHPEEAEAMAAAAQALAAREAKVLERFLEELEPLLAVLAAKAEKQESR